MPKFPKGRPMPAYDIARPPRMLLKPSLGALSYAAAVNHRAEAIVDWLYGKAEAAPHGFYNPLGFIEASRRHTQRNRIYSWLCRRIIERDAARGRIKIEGSFISPMEQAA